MLHTIRDTFPAVFSGGGRTKPHSQRYREFSEDWGMQKILFELASETLTEIPKVYQEYLTDTLMFLTYTIKKGEMEEEEEKWQEQRRKAMKGS